MVVLLLYPASASGQEPAIQAAPRVSAERLIHLMRFVEWPPSALMAADRLLLCVWRDRAVLAELERHARMRSVRGWRIETAALTVGSDPSACHAVFLGGAAGPEWRQLLYQLRGKPVLTVSGAPAFLDHGGIIRLMGESGGRRLAVNQEAAQLGRLRISAQVLRVAAFVRVGGGR